MSGNQVDRSLRRRVGGDEQEGPPASVAAPVSLSSAHSDANVGPVRPAREFRDHMSGEGEVSHIPRIIHVMYASLLTYSILASMATGSAWYTQVVFYFVYMLEFYVWHWMAHQKFTGRMHQLHSAHHFTHFPPNHFYGKPGTDQALLHYGCSVPTLWQLMDPRKSTNVSLYHEGPLYGMMILHLMLAYHVFHCSFATLGFALFLGIVIGAVGSALHSSFHVRGFQLERFQGYLELRTLHYLHHLGSTKHNYAVLNHELLDGFLNSLKTTDPQPSKTTSDDDDDEGTAKPEAKGKSTDDDLAAPSFPEKITARTVCLANKTTGSLGRYLLLQSISDQRGGRDGRSAVKRGYPTIFVRFLLVVLAVAFWQSGAQQLMSYTDAIRRFEGVELGDIGHALTAGLNRFIGDGGASCTLLHNAQVCLSNVLSVYFILLSILGTSCRPALSILLALFGRTLCHFVTPFLALSAGRLSCPLTAASLLSTDVTPVEFLCPHIILSLTLVFECFWNPFMRGAAWKAIAAVVLAFQIGAPLVMRTTWTIDLVFILNISLCAAMIARKMAPRLDFIRSV